MPHFFVQKYLRCEFLVARSLSGAKLLILSNFLAPGFQLIGWLQPGST